MEPRWPSWTQYGAKTAPRWPKMRQDRPKRAPRWSQDGQVGANMEPRWRQDSPKMAKFGPRWSQDGAKIAPRWPKMRQHRPTYASMLKNIKNTMVFHYFGGRQGGQRLENPAPRAARRAQARTHFVRSIAPRVLISPSITLVSVLSGIRQNPSVQALFGEPCLSKGTGSALKCKIVVPSTFQVAPCC